MFRYNSITECPHCSCEIFNEDISNSEFDKVILSLLGSEHVLTKEEEDTIRKIAEKFIYKR